MELLIDEIKNKGIIQFGEFVLKSGVKSNVYANFKNLYSYPNIFDGITKIMLRQMQYSNFDFDRKHIHIIGIPTGAVPMATSIARLGNYPQLLLRTEKKDYGTKKQIEGVYSPGDKIILVEDVVTTGGSIREAIKIVKEHGLKIVGILSIFDRSEEYGNLTNDNRSGNIDGIPYKFTLNMYDVNYTKTTESK